MDISVSVARWKYSSRLDEDNVPRRRLQEEEWTSGASNRVESKSFRLFIVFAFNEELSSEVSAKASLCGRNIEQKLEAYFCQDNRY